MSVRSTAEEVLPEILERRQILEHARIVLAKARSLLACLDQTEGKLNGRLSGVENKIVVVGLPKSKEMSKASRWSS
jgi:hypothetical protein